MKSDFLEDLLHDELRSLYSAEKQLVKALRKLARAARWPKLQTVLITRLRETGVQIQRLEQIAKLLNRSLAGSKCTFMEQLIEEGERLISEHAASDSGLIAAAQHLEGYEIEGYRIARNLASRLGLDEVEALLQKNLDEEEATTTKLARLSLARPCVDEDREGRAFMPHGTFSATLCVMS